MPDIIIAGHPPNDGRDWDAQCARCGSGVTSEDCWDCDGYGEREHDCGEDTCCCLEPDGEPCERCRSTGQILVCISDADWCAEHPLPGREALIRGEPEWFVVGQREAMGNG